MGALRVARRYTAVDLVGVGAGGHAFSWGGASSACRGDKTAATLGDSWAWGMGVYLSHDMVLPVPWIQVP